MLLLKKSHNMWPFVNNFYDEVDLHSDLQCIPAHSSHFAGFYSDLKISVLP